MIRSSLAEEISLKNETAFVTCYAYYGESKIDGSCVEPNGMRTWSS